MKINIGNGIFLFPIIPFIFPNFSIDSSFLSNTIVFISIFFGFTSSSFAMIIFSNYAKSAYAKKSDQKNMFYKISDIYKKIFTIQISIIVFSLCYTTFSNFFINYINNHIFIFEDINFSVICSNIFEKLLPCSYLSIISYNIHLFYKLIRVCENFAVIMIRNQYNTPPPM